MGISTFIILKNEQDTLMKTLQSAAKFSDEIIIGIDSTTDDRSVDIIGDFLPSYSGEVEIYEFTWEDDFAKARNEAIKRCTKEWIFQLDAHEYIRPGDEEKIIRLTRQLSEQIWLVAVQLWDEWSGGQPNSRFYQDHLFRNAKQICYSGAMHNYIGREICPPDRRTRCPDIVVYHQRTEENERRRKLQRLQMAEKVLLPAVKSNSSDLRSIFYLAQTYLNSEMLSKAARYYRLYIARSKRLGIPMPGEHTWAYYKLGMIAIARGNYDTAVDFLFKSLKFRADSPEAYLALGEAYLLKGDAAQAERFLIVAANTTPADDHLFLYGAALSYAPWLRLMQLYFNRDEQIKAFRAGMIGLTKSPDNNQLLAGVKICLKIAAEKIKTEDSAKKNLYVVDKTGQFTPRLIEEWEKDFNVHFHKTPDLAYMRWADITFVEWGDENLVAASQHRFPCKLVARVHRYEAFSPVFKSINWKNVDLLVYTSEHIRRIAGSAECESIIVENSVDISRYTLLESFDRRSCAYVGYIHKRKNLSYLIQLLAEIKEPFVLHVAGEFQDLEYKEFIHHQIWLLGMKDRIIYHGWQDDIESWLNKIHPAFILSGSTSEGLPYSLLEAMAKGIRPVLYHYPGAEKQFPQEAIFKDSKEFRKLMSDESIPPVHWRRIVDERYSFEREAGQFSDLFDQLLSDKQSPV